MILVLTPLRIEKELLKAALGPDSRVRVERGGHGKVEFALNAAKWIQELKPGLLICAGAAGALDSSLEIGQIIAAENTIEHDFNLRFEPAPLPRFKGDERALAALRSESSVRFGSIASGDEDVIDTERRQAIRQATAAVAVAWEGAGGARAARFHKTRFLELRAITDRADSHAIGDFQSNLALGMRNLAKVLSADGFLGLA